MEENQWSKPQCLSPPPEPREHHAACFLAERYLIIWGGIDQAGRIIDGASVYDVNTATWMTINCEESRAHHRLICHGGLVYICGGVNPADRGDVPVVPLSVRTYSFVQQSCFDFVGNNAQCISIKPSPSLNGAKRDEETKLLGPGLSNTFSVEAVVYVRSFSAGTSPIVCKTDSNFRSGFGLVGMEHPAFKGDAEEGPWVHFFVGQITPGQHQMVGAKIDLRAWLHVAATYDGNNISIFVNGQEKEVKEWVVTEEEAETLHTKGDVTIGGIPGKWAFDGLIDECRVWDECRKEDQLKANMNSPFCNPVTPHLVGQWTFNEGAGDLVIDSSGSRNHASFDRYAGGVELRRVQSSKGTIELHKTEREKHIEENFKKVQAWKDEFEVRNGRPPNMADMALADPEITAMARRLGEFDP